VQHIPAPTLGQELSDGSLSQKSTFKKQTTSLFRLAPRVVHVTGFRVPTAMRTQHADGI
jgi:hypothetical protein